MLVLALGGGERAGGAALEPMTELPYREALEAMRERFSRDYLLALLRECGGNVTRAAERAGVERESLHRLLRRAGLDASVYRGAGQAN